MVKVREEALAIREENSFELSPTGAAAQAQYEIQSAIVVARRFPRNESQAFEKLMKATQRTSFSEDAMYSFPRGGATVEGPSVNLAREAARVWGNIRYGSEVIRDDDESRQIQSWAWDLETNVKTSAQDDFKKLIFRKGPGWFVPDDRDLRELTNRRGAILSRNCILQILPKDLIEDAMNECKKTLQKGAQSDPDSARKKIILAFSSLNISTEMLEGYLEHKLSECSPTEIADLRTVYVSIKDGNSTWQEYANKKNATQETGTLSMDDLKPGKGENRGHGEENLDKVSSPEKDKVAEATKPPEQKPKVKTEPEKPKKIGKEKIATPAPTTISKEIISARIQETAQAIRDQFGEDISEEEFDSKFTELSGKTFNYFIDAKHEDVIAIAGIVMEKLKGLKK